MQSEGGLKPQNAGRFLFFLVCLYWLSQAFLIPLAPVGPSWAVWPTLSDLTVVAMTPFVLRNPFRKNHAQETNRLLTLAWNAFFLCFASFILATAFYGAHNAHVTNGIYQLVRSLEYLAVLLASIQTNLTPPRWGIIRRIALITFCLISVGVLLTSSGIVNTVIVTPLLPASPALAGPWGAYVSGNTPDGGFISYNHGYVGMQLILSGGAVYFFFEQSRPIRFVVCSMLLLSTFLSRSRVSFIVALVLLLAWEWKRKKSNLLALGALGLLACVWAIHSLAAEDLVERQSSTVSAMDNDGLSGRTTIWQDHLDYFSSHPLNAIVGAGYGYAEMASDTNAHDLYLQVATETGLVGIMIFIYMQRQTMLVLRPPQLRTIYLTVSALLITGLTQETLYPVVSFSHFLGFYLSVLAVSLRFLDASTCSLGHPSGLNELSSPRLGSEEAA